MPRIRELKNEDTANGYDLARTISAQVQLGMGTPPMVIAKIGGKNVPIKGVEIVKHPNGTPVVVLKA